MELEMLKKIISQVLSVDIKEIELSSSFVDDLGADSLDLYQIVLAVEEQFNIVLADEDITDINTVEDAINCIEQLYAE